MREPARYVGGGQWLVDAGHGPFIIQEPALPPLGPICLFALLIVPSNIYRPKQGRKKPRGRRAKRLSQYRWAKYVHLRWETARQCPCSGHGGRPSTDASP